jgi:hypothetical protein
MNATTGKPNWNWKPQMSTKLQLRANITVILALLTCSVSATEIKCVVGNKVSADLGEGVTMHTCLWEKEPDKVIRTGPIELIKNGVLILQTQTNLDGKLHGKFTSWSDEGVVILEGSYVEGLKQGPRLETENNGKNQAILYHNGNPVEP